MIIYQSRKLWVALACLFVVLVAIHAVPGLNIVSSNDNVPGVLPGWNGDGINPFMDYAHEGEISINLYDLSRNIVREIQTFKGRGMDLELRMVRTSNDNVFNPFRFLPYWRLDLPHVFTAQNGYQVLYLPGGATFNLVNGVNGYGGKVYTSNGEKVIVKYVGSTMHITFKDGSTISKSAGKQVYKDCNGNMITFITSPKYYAKEIKDDIHRVTKITDTVGREFNLTYNGINLTKIDQKLSNGQSRTILSIEGNHSNGFTFIDVMGKKTIYNKSDEIIYPNNTSVKIEVNSGKVYQKWFHKGNSTPVRTVVYSSKNNKQYTEVNDGVRIKRYYFTNSSFKDPESKWDVNFSPVIPDGYTYKEETYENNNGSIGKLLKRVLTSFNFYLYYNNLDVRKQRSYARPRIVTTYFAKENESLGTGSKYSYEYDDWGNVIKAIDPNGTETHMAYANTDSKRNLSDITRPESTTTWTKMPLNFTGGWDVTGDQNGYRLFVNYSHGSNKTIEFKISTVVSLGQHGGDISFNSSIYSGKSVYFKVDGVTICQIKADKVSLPAGDHTLEWLFIGYTGPMYGCCCTISNLVVRKKNVYTPPAGTQYQDYYYNSSIGSYSNIGYDKLLTKATIVKDGINKTEKLRQTHYKYDSKGNITEISQAHGNGYIKTKNSYDAYGNLLTTCDARENELRFQYLDNPNNSSFKSVYLKRVYRPDGTTIAEFAYGPDGNGNNGFDLGLKTQAIDPKGNVFRFDYDALGRLKKEYLNHASDGVTRELTYDDVNNTVQISYGNNDGSKRQIGLFTFDKIFGKLSKIQRKSGTSWHLVKESKFDSDGRVVLEKDGEGHETKYAYDALDRPTQISLPNNDTTNITWDVVTEASLDYLVKTIEDAKKNKTKQYFDSLGRLAKVLEYPGDGSTYTTRYTYNSYFDPGDENNGGSNLVQVVNANNAVTKYEYDDLGRLVKTEFPQDGTNRLASETYVYDNVSNLVQKTGAYGAKKFDYEFYSGYRLKKVTEPNNRTITYTYDNNDNILSQTSPEARYDYTYNARNQAKTYKTILDGNTFLFEYGYDAFGRMSSIKYPGRATPVTYTYDELDRLNTASGFVTSCTYDKDSKLTAMKLANGLVNSFAYDTNDRPSTIYAADYGALMNLGYSYDKAGNVSSINGDYYEYDGLNRLTWAGNMSKHEVVSNKRAWGLGTAWTYDPAGNMKSRSSYLKGQASGSINFSYDKANRLWSMGNTSFMNDNYGSRTQKRIGSETWDYSYDRDGRMTRVMKNGSVIEDNYYDGSGMRVKKVKGTKTTYYIYSGPNPIMEYDTSTGKYTYYIFAGSRSIAEEKDGQKIFYHRDHLGSTRALTDGNRKLVGLCKYDAWGKIESTNEYDEGVINGDMEIRNNATTPRRWVRINDTAALDCAYDLTGGLQGSAALKITRNTGTTATAWSMPSIFASKDTDYVLTGSYRSGVSSSTARASLIYYNTSGSVVATHTTGTLAYSSAWKTFTFSSRAPSTAVKMEIRLSMDSGNGTTVFFDGVRLKVPGLQGNYDYTGKREDEGTGLMYFGARFYDPETCRFMTMDPARDGLNWWEYCRSNPLGNVDPNGEEVITISVGVYVGATAIVTWYLANAPAINMAASEVLTVYGDKIAGMFQWASNTGDAIKDKMGKNESGDSGSSNNNRSSKNGQRNKPTSRTFGKPIETTIKGKKVQLRVDAEPISNKIQIQAGHGKDSIVDIRIDISKPIAQQIPKNLNLSEGQISKLCGYIEQAARFFGELKEECYDSLRVN